MTALDITPVPDYRQLARLDGKGYVVIGAGQGIGRQAAHALTQAGAKVMCVGRGREMTEAVAGEVGGFACLGDATQRSDVERIFSQAEEKLGGVHGIVDSLGMVRRKALLDFTDEDWEWQFDIVLRHAFLAMQIGGRAIARSGGGSITFVGSTAGMTWSTCHTVYGTAKAALHNMVRTAAVELGPLRVRVNVVVPGVVRTPRVQAYLDAGRGETAVNYYPLGRLATPADIASVILFMATDSSAYVTGQALLVDGGLLSQSPMPDSVWFPENR
jgi:NAD(P)-dependent dehydrogenase (short-subunit alcohol dehydrogenase family)